MSARGPCAVPGGCLGSRAISAVRLAAQRAPSVRGPDLVGKQRKPTCQLLEAGKALDGTDKAPGCPPRTPGLPSCPSQGPGSQVRVCPRAESHSPAQGQMAPLPRFRGGEATRLRHAARPGVASRRGAGGRGLPPLSACAGVPICSHSECHQAACAHVSLTCVCNAHAPRWHCRQTAHLHTTVSTSFLSLHVRETHEHAPSHTHACALHDVE